MDKDKNAVDKAQGAASGEAGTIQQPPVTEKDAEAKIIELEAEKARLIAERDNYKTGMLKAKGKIPAEGTDLEETDEEKMRRIAREEASNQKINAIDAEKEALFQKTLKENKELKLAIANKTVAPPAAQGSHIESTPVRDTTITAEQMEYFKKRGWSDKDIERYKNNLRKKV